MADGDEPRVIGEFSNYDELINALCKRAAELNLSGETVDSFAGLPARYTQKLLGPNQIRRLGAISLGPFLGALGVRCLIVEDKAAVERLRSQITPRQAQYARPGMRAGSVQILLTDRFMQKIRKKGGQNSRKYLGKRLVKQLARKAAAARHQNLRRRAGPEVQALRLGEGRLPHPVARRARSGTTAQALHRALLGEAAMTTDRRLRCSSPLKVLKVLT